MKKVWQKPVLDELNISMTMHGITGNVVDGTVKEPDPGNEIFDTHGPHS
jgi:hypothetical protein